MTNNTNIYDIDGELVRAAGDNHKITIEEAQQAIQKYQEKYKALLEKGLETNEDRVKAAQYQIYMRNLMNYEWAEMSKMKPDELTEFLKKNAPKEEEKDIKEQVENALNELKNDVETGRSAEDEISGSSTGHNTSIADGESGDDQAVERGFGDVHEEKVLSQDDLLVERADVTPTVMDEYVSPIEEK